VKVEVAGVRRFTISMHVILWRRTSFVTSRGAPSGKTSSDIVPSNISDPLARGFEVSADYLSWEGVSLKRLGRFVESRRMASPVEVFWCFVHPGVPRRNVRSRDPRTIVPCMYTRQGACT
jgi:hypothetical protein